MTSTEVNRTVTRKLQDKEGYPVWALQTEIYRYVYHFNYQRPVGSRIPLVEPLGQ